jgi:hypothetical protein
MHAFWLKLNVFQGHWQTQVARNSVLLVPNDEMKKNRAKFNRTYIEVTGTVKLTVAEHGDYIVAIKDIQTLRFLCRM